MTASTRTRPLLGEVLPGAVVALLAAIAMSAAVPELSDRLPLLLLAGAAGVGAAVVWLRRTDAGVIGESIATPEPVSIAGEQSTTSAPLSRIVTASVAGVESLSLSKEGAADDENEDSWAVVADRGVIAVADGASSSFASRVWSAALVGAATADAGALDAAFVQRVAARAAGDWTRHHEGQDLPWWAQEGLRRGAFATLLVVRVGSDAGVTRWQALAVGDSCVMQLRRTGGVWAVVTSFPLTSAAAFGSHPDLLSSVTPPAAAPALAEGVLQAGDVLVAATDAVSEWLLSGEAARLTLIAESPMDAIADAIRAARVDRSMVNDDATIVRWPAG